MQKDAAAFNRRHLELHGKKQVTIRFITIKIFIGTPNQTGGFRIRANLVNLAPPQLFAGHFESRKIIFYNL